MNQARIIQYPLRADNAGQIPPQLRNSYVPHRVHAETRGVTVVGKSLQIAGENVNRVFFILQNRGLGALYYRFGAEAKQDINSLLLRPGCEVMLEAPNVPANPLYVNGMTSATFSEGTILGNF